MQSALQSDVIKRYQLVTDAKAGGATYTPKRLADFVAAQMIDAVTGSDLRTCVHILDPAAGDGTLLISLLTMLYARGHTNLVITGFDTDANALSQAQQRIGVQFPHADLHLVLGSFLDFVLAKDRRYVDGPQSPGWENSGFDFIIANPPYVRTQIMGAQRAQEVAAAFHLAGRVDLYYAFLMGIAAELKPKGTAGMIVSNRFMSTKSGGALRTALRTRYALQHIWDFGDTKLFDAAVLPAVIIAKGRDGEEARPIRFSSIYETHEDALLYADDPIAAVLMTGGVAGNIAVSDGRRFHVQHGALDKFGATGQVWRMATSAGDAWLATVASHTWGTFRDIGKIRVGVKTCADRVFIRHDWHRLPVDKQPELLRPLTTHHIARRFRATQHHQKREILYPHESVNGRRQVVDLSDHPRSRAYLEDFRADLEARGYVLAAGRQWYEIWVPHHPAAWDAPKLVFRDIAARPTFWLDFEGSIVNGDCYWLAADRSADVDLLWLAAAVANSRFCEAFYDHRFHNKLYAGRRRFITQYVEQFPLPNPASALAREIIAAAKEIYAGAETTQAQAFEADLEQLVCKAFGLSMDECIRGERIENRVARATSVRGDTC